MKYFVLKIGQGGDFLGGPMIKNPPSYAGDVGSIPGWETKIPHATGELSLHATNYRAHALWSPRATTTGPTYPGACVPQLERENPRTTTREEPACRN